MAPIRMRRAVLRPARMRLRISSRLLMTARLSCGHRGRARLFTVISGKREALGRRQKETACSSTPIHRHEGRPAVRQIAMLGPASANGSDAKTARACRRCARTPAPMRVTNRYTPAASPALPTLHAHVRGLPGRRRSNASSRHALSLRIGIRPAPCSQRRTARASGTARNARCRSSPAWCGPIGPA